MSFFRPNDTILDKIALVFVLTVVGLIVLAALCGFIYVMWSINPFLAIIFTLFVAAMTYLTRGGPAAKP
jgi:hypothetical protein